MRVPILFAVTALAEIVGCYAAYAVLRLGRHPAWLLAAVLLLGLFAWLLTLHPVEGAGRVYAAYGGVYITASVFWMWLVEKLVPDRWDIAGAILCLGGAGVIIFAPRS